MTLSTLHTGIPEGASPEDILHDITRCAKQLQERAEEAERERDEVVELLEAEVGCSMATRHRRLRNLVKELLAIPRTPHKDRKLPIELYKRLYDEINGAGAYNQHHDRE